ncbi:hypothetical protein PVAP13_8KG169602 [Panicum virgatum]|uniref:Uncharacterized protein n=1 Tax=Panicum virgatum TaxID=38727 RepID=A0A8T0PI68_PANVG|nr:hypothetical protein PVAP13_8KG169602 [Panicum virgatum]
MAGRKRWNHNSRTQPRNKEGRFFRPFSPSTSPSPSPSTSLSPSPSPSSSRLPSPSPSPSRDPYPTTVPGASPSNYKGKGPASSKVKKNSRSTVFTKGLRSIHFSGDVLPLPTMEHFIHAISCLLGTCNLITLKMQGRELETATSSGSANK